jgi:DNA-binding MarR family transcriptional regulator
MAADARNGYRFGDVLALARRSWVQQVQRRMAEAGFADYRRTDAWMLRLLTGEPLPIGRLGEAMGVTRQTARQLADGLVDRRLATFDVDPGDARRRLVTLTPEGETYARAVRETQDALNSTLRRRVSAQDLVIADSVLRAVFPTGDARRRVDVLVPPPGAP